MSFLPRHVPHLAALLCASLILAACGDHDEAPRVASEPGVLLVATQPGDAELRVDGEPRGRTPAEPGQTLAVKLPPGTYTLEVHKAGDERSEWVGRREGVVVSDQPLPVMTLQLERRLTPAGEQARADEQARLQAREQSLAAGFVLDGAGTATDAASGLMWMRCSLGQAWTGETCAGEPQRFNWMQAVEAGEAAQLAGHDDWRLPTREELHALTYCSSGRRYAPDSEGEGGGCEGDFRRPTILESVFPNTPAANYWTATPHPVYSYSAFGVAFGNGVLGAGGRTEHVHARLVRDVR